MVLAATLVLVSHLPALARAQAPRIDAVAEFTSRRITTADGLPQNSVNELMLGADGALWLATFGGLSRYDGQRIAVIASGAAGQL
jgi:ligand-binding sensor domain-containing protein